MASGHLFLGRLVLKGGSGFSVVDEGHWLKHTAPSGPCSLEPGSRYFSQRFSEGWGSSYGIGKGVYSQSWKAGTSPENPQPYSEA